MCSPLKKEKIMDKITILAILGMGGLGLFFAIVLAIVSEKFKVTEDPKIEELTKALPGINCGACGFLSCYDYAQNLAVEGADITKCKPGGDSTQEAISKILGVDTTCTGKAVGVVHCVAGNDVKLKKAKYTGVNTCAGANITSGGSDLCNYGCLGFGDCTKICEFDALHMENGLPVFDMNKCVSCLKCQEACPRNLISFEPVEDDWKVTYVGCSSKEAGAQTRKECSVGCIGCTICAKMTDNAFEIKDFLARRIFDKIKNCEKKNIAIEKCPTKVIKQK